MIGKSHDRHDRHDSHDRAPDDLWFDWIKPPVSVGASWLQIYRMFATSREQFVITRGGGGGLSLDSGVRR